MYAHAPESNVTLIRIVVRYVARGYTCVYVNDIISCMRNECISDSQALDDLLINWMRISEYQEHE